MVGQDGRGSADGRYYGRNDTTPYVLSDAEVRRLLERRRVREDEGLALDAEIAYDPIPEEMREQAHLFLVAEPVDIAGRDLLVPVLDDRDWNLTVSQMIEAGAGSPQVLSALGEHNWSPNLWSTGYGAAKTNGSLIPAAPGAITDRLVGHLLRGMDVYRSWRDQLTDATGTIGPAEPGN